MRRLIEIGFIKVGEWSLNNGRISHDIINHLNQRKILYAFVSEEEPLYIGKTTDTLKSRMTGYKNANSSQKTNIRVNAEILETLRGNNTVEIYIFIDQANLNYNGYNICLASGLEDTLISIIRPRWNR